jgi:TolB protein
LVTPKPSPTASGGLVPLDVEVAGNGRQINARIADSYAAWRQEVLAQSGYDFLGRVSDVYRPLGYSGRDYGHLSWHRTGRAVDTLFEWHDPAEGPNLLVVVREDLGAQTYWRLYLRTRVQDGTLGEPLTEPQWAFWFELDPAREPEAYANGGRPDDIPPGLYVDVTQLAGRHGWGRIASYEEEDFDWRNDSVGREFWHYQRTDGLTWWEAMLELYPEETLEGYYSWQICTEELGMDPAWLRAKGIPEEVEP